MYKKIKLTIFTIFIGICLVLSDFDFNFKRSNSTYVPVVKAESIKSTDVDPNDEYAIKMRYGYNLFSGEPVYALGGYNTSYPILESLENGLYKHMTHSPLTARETYGGQEVGYSSTEIASKVSNVLSGGIGGKISSVLLDINAKFDRNSKVTNTYQERYETCFQYAIRDEYSFVNTLGDIRNYLAKEFKEDLYSVKSVNDAKDLFNNYGTHLFTRRQLGGVLEATSYISTSSSSVDIKNVTSLEAKISYISAMRASGNLEATIEQEYEKNENSTNQSSKNRCRLYGGISIPATSLDHIFKYSSDIVGQHYLYGNWLDAINDRNGLVVVNIPQNARKIPLWELLEDDVNNNEIRNYLVNAYTELCGDKYDEYLKKYPMITQRKKKDETSGIFVVNGYGIKTSEDNQIANVIYKKFPDDDSENTANLVYPGSIVTLSCSSDNIPIDKKKFEFTKENNSKYTYVESESIDELNNSFRISTSACLDENFILSIKSSNETIKQIKFKVVEKMYSGGNGSKDNPYLISNESDFYTFLYDSNSFEKSFKLTNDIDFKESEINSIVDNFKGTFDGNFCTLKNFKIKSKSKDNDLYMTLFGCNSGTIKNLFVENESLSEFESNNLTFDSYNNIYIGGLVGKNENGTIKNCKIKTIYIKNKYYTKKDLNSYVGGLVGYTTDIDSKIENCSISDLDVKVICNDKDKKLGIETIIGGIVGKSINSSIKNVYIRDIKAIKGQSGSKKGSIAVAGVVGYLAENSKLASAVCDKVAGDFSALTAKSLERVNYLVCWIDDDSIHNIGTCYYCPKDNSDIEPGVSSTEQKGSIDFKSTTSLDKIEWMSGYNSFPVLKSQENIKITSISTDESNSLYYDKEFNPSLYYIVCTNAKSDTIVCDSYICDYSKYEKNKVTKNQKVIFTCLGKDITQNFDTRKQEIIDIVLISKKTNLTTADVFSENDYKIEMTFEDGSKEKLENNGDISLKEAIEKLKIKYEYVNIPFDNISIYLDSANQENKTYGLGSNEIICEAVGYEKLKNSIIIEVIKSEIEKVELITEPKRKQYYVGETFSTDGMKVEVTFKNNIKKIVDNSELEIIGGNITIGKNSIIISYGDYFHSFTLDDIVGIADKCIIIFKNDDGTILSSKTYRKGDNIDVPNPKKASDETFEYIFKSWDKEVKQICDGDATYIAIYETKYIDYIVKFLDWDNKEISNKTYHYGDNIMVPNNPIRKSDNNYKYTFKSWDKEVSKTCTGNVTYIALYDYEKTDNENIEYTIKFLDWNNKEIISKTYHYGEVIDLPINPTRESDNTYEYTFKSWNKEVNMICEGNAVYVAVYDEKYIEYIIKFLDDEGNVISNKKYHYGDEIEMPAFPKKESDDKYEYTFDTWDKDVSVRCTGDAIYRAKFKNTPINKKGCKGETTSFIGMLALLGILCLKKRKI